VCGVFDIVFFPCKTIATRISATGFILLTSFRHDAHNTLYLLFLRMYILQKYMVSFFCICVSFWLSLLYCWLMYCYFYYPAFCFYHCKYYYCWCFVAILWPHIASRDCCYTILMLPNPHLHYSSSSLNICQAVHCWSNIALFVIRGFCQNFSPDLVLILP